MKLCQYLAEIEGAFNESAVDAAVDKFFSEDVIHLPRILKDLEATPDLIRYLCEILTRQTKFLPAHQSEAFQTSLCDRDHRSR